MGKIKKNYMEKTIDSKTSYAISCGLREVYGGEVMVDVEQRRFAVRRGERVYDINGDVTGEGVWTEWWLLEMNNSQLAKELI